MDGSGRLEVGGPLMWEIKLRAEEPNSPLQQASATPHAPTPSSRHDTACLILAVMMARTSCPGFLLVDFLHAACQKDAPVKSCSGWVNQEIMAEVPEIVPVL